MKVNIERIKVWTLRSSKGLAIIFGLYLIFGAIHVVAAGNWTLLGWLFTGMIKVTGFAIPYLLILLIKSIYFMWPPILAYVIIGTITVSKWWRLYLCLSVMAAAIILLNGLILSKLDLSISALKQVPDIFLYLIHIYFLLLWTLPREFWNFVGGIVFALKSFAITVMPDLPGFFDDLGMIFAIFVFIFLYINTIASIIQRIMDEKVIRRARSYFRSIAMKTPLKNYLTAQSMYPDNHTPVEG